MICFFGFLVIQAQETAESIQRELTALLEKESKNDFSGTVLVIRHGDALLSESFGYSDRNKKVLNQANTIYDIGSLTKQFTAAAILRLEMAGKLSVSDEVSMYLKEFRTLKYPVTIHQLLTHSAGLPGAMGDDYAEISENEFIKLAIRNINNTSSNHKYEYSNVGYSLLAIIIERVSNMDYEEFLHKELFEPADMDQTGYKMPQWSEELVAHGYNKKEDWGTPNSKNWSAEGPYLHLKGNGGILSNAGDLYKWSLALEGDKILNEEAKRKYFQQHIAEDDTNFSFYGYGWVIIPGSKKGNLITHNGGNGYFFADFWNFPEEEHTVIVLSNSANRRVEDLAARIARLL